MVHLLGWGHWSSNYAFAAIMLVLSNGLFGASTAIAQVTAQSVSFEDRIEQIGFADTEILERGSGWVLARGRQNLRSTYWTYFFVHDLPMGTEILVPDGFIDIFGQPRANYSGIILDRLRASTQVRQRICPRGSCYGTQQYGHYFLGFRSERKKNPLADESYEAPPLLSNAKDVDRDDVIDVETYYPLPRIIGPLPSSIDRLCMAEGFHDRNATPEEVMSVCGTTGQSPLADRGIGYAIPLKRTPVGEFFIADVSEINGPGEPNYYSNALVLISNAEENDDLVTDALVSALIDLEDEHGLHINVGRSIHLKIYSDTYSHPLYGISPSEGGSIQPSRVEKPFLKLILHWTEARGFDLGLEKWRRHLQDANTSIGEVAGRLGRILATRRTQEQSDRPVLSELERLELRFADAAWVADQYGHLSFDPDYFGIDPLDPPPSFALAEYLTGGYSLGVDHTWRPDYRTLLQSYVYMFSEQCTGEYRAGVSPFAITVTTTRTTHDGDGNQIGEPRVIEEIDVYAHNDIIPTWRRVFDTEEGGLGDQQRVAQGMDIIRSFFSNPSQTIADPLRYVRAPERAMRWFLDKEGCDSPALTQLRQNLIRAAAGEPSVNLARETYNGSTGRGPRGVGAGKLLYEHYEPGLARVTYMFGETPMGWSANLDRYLEQAVSHYGATQVHHLQGEIPLMVTLQNSTPAYGALSAMRTAKLGFFPRESRKLDRIGELLYFANDERALSQNVQEQMALRSQFIAFSEAHPDQFYVECEYSDGSSLMYWLDQVPFYHSPSFWRSQHPQHPMADVEAPRQGCPPTSQGL